MLGTIGSKLAAAKGCEQLSLDDRRVLFLGYTESLEAIPGNHNSGAAIEAKACIVVTNHSVAARNRVLKAALREAAPQC